MVTPDDDDVSSQDITDSTYVDDEVLMLAADTPGELDVKIDELLGLLCSVFKAFKLTINWAKGKKEAILTYRGADAGKHWRDRFVDGIPVVSVPDGSTLQVVQQYKHVGSVVTASGTLAPEAQARAKSALAAWYKLAANVFGSSHLSVETKSCLAQSLVFSRLYFGCETWPEVKPAVLRILEAVQTRAARRILESWNTSGTSASPPHHNTTNIELRKRLKWPSVQCELRRRRLQYLSRLCRHAPRSLLALIQSRPGGHRLPWVNTIIEDLCQLRLFHENKLLELSEPADWYNFILQHPCAWKQLVDQYIVYDSIAPVARHEPVFLCQTLPEQKWFACTQCPEDACRVFPTMHSLRSHIVAKHKYRAAARLHVRGDGVCPICKLCFHTRVRAIAHVQRSGSRCALLLHESPQLHPDEVEALDKADKLSVRAAVKAGHARPLALMPGPPKGPKKLG